MKNVLMIALLSVASFSVNAGVSSPAQMRANFDVCAENVPYWMQNFGQYVVAFDHKTAFNFCNRNHFNPRVTQAYCRADGKTLQAGFYCENSFGGN